MESVRWMLQGERRVGACRTGNVEMPPPPASSPLRMLVVDDVEIHRALLSGMLALLFPAATVDEAGDGREAQRKIEAQRYDIVLSDWMMPNMDGVALADWLKRSETRPPFVLFSAHDECEQITALFSSPGIDGYLVKPHDHAAMKEVLSTVLAAPAQRA